MTLMHYTIYIYAYVCAARSRPCNSMFYTVGYSIPGVGNTYQEVVIEEGVGSDSESEALANDPQYNPGAGSIEVWYVDSHIYVDL